MIKSYGKSAVVCRGANALARIAMHVRSALSFRAGKWIRAHISAAESAIPSSPRPVRYDEKRKLDEEERPRQGGQLTDHGEEHGMTHGRRCGHLTLVCPGISLLRIFHL